MEVELKFQVPAASRAAVLRALATPSASRLRLRAVYADTADQRLAQAGLALRLRQEGRRWVQTLKGRGDGLMQRLEHEVPLPRAPRPLLPTPALHASHPAGARLLEVLGEAVGEAPLIERFGTDIQRVARLLRVPGASVEVAFDVGQLHAGKRRAAVCELEFELKSGTPAALLALAARWVHRHGLWLDVRSKAEAGQRLADGLSSVPPTTASRPALQREQTPAEAFGQVLQACLAHLLPNQAELATPGLPDAARQLHLHQWRVAARRLRSALKALGRWSAQPELAQALERRWAEAFAATSAARDADVAARLLAEPLREAGLALPATEALPAHDPVWFSAPTLTLLVLDTMALAWARPAEAPAAAAETPTLRVAARSQWRRLLKPLRQPIDGFAKLSVEERHRLRKRLKRLRYVAEFLAPVLPARDFDKVLLRLRRALDDLGQLNDTVVAQTLVQGWPDSPAAWFARGWLQARLPQVQARAEASIGRLGCLRRLGAR